MLPTAGRSTPISPRLEMLGKLHDPRYPIKNDGYNPSLGLVTFGSTQDIEEKVSDPDQRKKAQEASRRDQIATNTFFSNLIGRPGLTFSPRDMNSLIAEIVIRKPQNLAEIMQMGFLKDVQDVDQFCAEINDPKLWGRLSKDGAKISMPQFVWGDFKKIVHCIEVARDPDMSAERKSMVYELLASNQLDPLDARSAADRHYVAHTPELAADTRLVNPSSSGQCVQRYQGGVHWANSRVSIWKKISARMLGQI
jgi:hypothetical protein